MCLLPMQIGSLSGEKCSAAPAHSVYTLLMSGFSRFLYFDVMLILVCAQTGM